MAGLILPNRFKSQPQYAAPIDRQGLGKGVQILFNPALGSVDLATGRVWTPSNAALVSINPGKYGKSFKFNAGFDAGYGYTGYPEITSNVGTFFMWLPVVGAADSFGHVYFGASSPAVSGHQVNASGQIIIGTGSGASSGSLSSWFNTSNRSLVLVSDGTAAGTKAYADGVDPGFTWGSPPTAWGAGSKNFNVGRYIGGTGFQVDGTILSVGMTSALWGAAEAKAFHESRGNALYKAPARRIYVATTAASGNGVGSSSGLATVTGVGAASSASVGSSSGLAAASGVGTSSTGSSGSASGLATVSGVGASVAASVGSSSGIAAVSGVGDSTSAGSAIGSASGISSVSGVGASVVYSVGSSDGVSTARGVSVPTGQQFSGGYGGVYYSREERDALRKKQREQLGIIKPEAATLNKFDINGLTEKKAGLPATKKQRISVRSQVDHEAINAELKRLIALDIEQEDKEILTLLMEL